MSDQDKDAAYNLAENDLYDIIDCVEEVADTIDRKPGPKPKKLVAIEVYGYQVGRGLKRTVVVPDEVFKLAAIGLTDREIASWVQCAEDTLRYNFADILAKGRTELKMSLRRAMLNNAINKNNAAVQIFLAKNYLSMSDSPHNTDDTKVLPWSDGDDDGAE